MTFLEMPLPHFLQIYLLLFLVALGLAAVLRWLLRGPGMKGQPLPALNPYEIAYLAGGGTLAVQATLACLMRDGTLYQNSPFPVDVSRGTASLPPRSALPSGIRSWTQPAAIQIRQRLQQCGLVLSKKRARLAQVVPMMLLLAVGLFGLVVVIGSLMHSRPVGVLAYAVTVTLLTAVFGFGRLTRRSRRGDEVLEQLRHDHAALGRSARRRVPALSAQEIILTVGLFGPNAVAAGPLKVLPVIQPDEELVGSSVD
jgi:uncharacterized protein (TIGR04222 family)